MFKLKKQIVALESNIYLSICTLDVGIVYKGVEQKYRFDTV